MCHHCTIISLPKISTNNLSCVYYLCFTFCLSQPFICVLIWVCFCFPQFCLKTMAHLPPKIPNMALNNWPHFPDHHKNIISSPPSWGEDFHGFSLARRGLHRRSVSDSIAFLETPMGIDSSLGLDAPSNDVFHGFDAEQFRSMVSDEVHPNEDDQPTSSDHNEKDAAGNDDQTHRLQNEPKEEVQSEFDNVATNVSNNRKTDPKRVKRIMANRESAQRSRVRKLQYITELERSVTTLQAEVSMLSPRVAFLDQQRLLLNVNNNALKQRIASLSQDKIFKDAHEEALKREIERLGELYDWQQQQKKNHCNVPSPVVTKEQPTSSGDQNQKLLYV